MEQERIRIAICGYGNLGKGVEKAIQQNKETELVAIFTRRDPKQIKSMTNCQVVKMQDVINNIESWKEKIDVVILCGGSATDLPEQGPLFAQYFNTIDSYDTHANIPTYYAAVNDSAMKGKNISIISVGWDPGLFSLNRLYAISILPKGKTYTFWGKGVSQGHSDAIRRIKGVKNAIQYTIPKEEAINQVRRGENPVLGVRDKHIRECFVVVEEGANKEEVEKQIVTMPNYFSDYDTIVHFVNEQELMENHQRMPHGGFVIHSGETGEKNKQTIEYHLTLDSNPEFTASVLIAYARAAYRMRRKGEIGAKTVFDIPPILLSSQSREENLKELL